MAKVDPTKVQTGTNPKPTTTSSVSEAPKSSVAIAIRAQNDPNSKNIFGVKFEDFFKAPAGSVGVVGSSFENLGKKVSSTSQITYSKAYKNISQNIASGSAGIAEGVDTFSTTLQRSLDNFSKQIDKNLEPFSEFVGSTLGTLTGVIQDPLGPNGLGNVATRLINSASPGMGDKINGLNQTLNLQAISRFPAQMMSGIDHILTGVRDLLSVPLSILSEIYYGYQAIMKSISKLVSGIIDGFSKFLLDFLDSIIPIKSILSLLDSISTLANQVGSIAGSFNISAITDVTSQITGFTDQFTDVLSNPLDFASSFLPANVSSFLSDIQDPQALFENLLPEQVSGFVDGIQNPENLIKQFLPGDLANGFDKLADMTGFGYHGNLGFGFKSVLEGTQKTVLQDIVGSFGDKMGALGPILAGQPDQPQGYKPELRAGHNAGLYNETRRVSKEQYKQAEPSEQQRYSDVEAS